MDQPQIPRTAQYNWLQEQLRPKTKAKTRRGGRKFQLKKLNRLLKATTEGFDPRVFDQPYVPDGESKNLWEHHESAGDFDPIIFDQPYVPNDDFVTIYEYDSPADNRVLTQVSITPDRANTPSKEASPPQPRAIPVVISNTEFNGRVIIK